MLKRVTIQISPEWYAALQAERDRPDRDSWGRPDR
jgi:hypothetical protein